MAEPSAPRDPRDEPEGPAHDQEHGAPRAEDGEGAPAGGGGRATDPRPGPPRTAYIADLVLVGACAWLLWSDFSASRAGDVELTARTWTFMLNLTCAFVLVHRAMALVQRGIRSPRMALTAGVFKWGLAIVVPLAVAIQLEHEVQLAHKKKLDALAVSIGERIRTSLTANGAVRAQDLETIDSPYVQELTVRTDSGRFLLRVLLPALDIDGYTGLYDSGAARWHVHHNDVEPDSRPSFDADGPLLRCTPATGGLRCEPS